MGTARPAWCVSWSRAALPPPGPAVLRQEHPLRVLRLLGSGPNGERLPDRLEGLRPQRAAARNAGLRTRVVHPSGVQVEGRERQVAHVAVAETGVDADQD